MNIKFVVTLEMSDSFIYVLWDAEMSSLFVVCIARSSKAGGITDVLIFKAFLPILTLETVAKNHERLKHKNNKN